MINIVKNIYSISGTSSEGIVVEFSYQRMDDSEFLSPPIKGDLKFLGGSAEVFMAYWNYYTECKLNSKPADKMELEIIFLPPNENVPSNTVGIAICRYK
ncbi:hypothetical protein [Providencia stuartii]|uniref:hypothetical protein n=1 Tax=Providencia stuartii TaxID=588 RepID=UPI0018C54FFD|nr:hypothetical protein [Providencia stuartii]MBG5920823.1 hypothetical protein [Providencia stuartii]